MQKFDFAVIGAGIAGASFAARVSRHARVLLLERESQGGYHSTGRSAALYSALYGEAEIRALTRASRAFFDAPPDGFAQAPLLTPRGVLYISPEPDHPALETLARSPQAERVPAESAYERVPILRVGEVTQAIFEARACDIDVHALHYGFLRQARAAHAVVTTNANVEGLEPGNAWRIHTGAGTYEAAVVVNAAGAWADEMAELAGVSRVGLSPLRRTAVLIDPAPLTGCNGWPAVVAADESYYFKPDAGMLLASPADETPSAPCDAQPEEMDIAVCVDRIERATTLEVRRIVRSWAGLRTFAPDRIPVVGYEPECPAYFWLAGQGGYGVQTAPALSDYAAALALHRPLPAYVCNEGLDAATLSPARLRRQDVRPATA
jgi:D-arginine dehydrogenase